MLEKKMVEREHVRVCYIIGTRLGLRDKDCETK